MPQNVNDLLDLARDIGDLASATGEAAMKVPVARTAVRGFCRVMSGTPGRAALEALDIPSICSPYWAEDGRTGPTQGPPPFSGGQCEGANYRVELTTNWTNAQGQPQQSVSNNGALGPIEGVQVQGNDVFITDGSSNSPRILFNGPSGSTVQSSNISNVTLLDPGEDNCGDPPSEFIPGTGYQGEQFDAPQMVPDQNGNNVPVIAFEPTIDASGNLSIPVNVGDVELNFGGGNGGGGETPTVDYDNPGPGESPGPGGGPDGGNNPPNGVDSNVRASAVTVTITTEPVNSSREVGSNENIFISGENSDGGWFRWKVGNGFTDPVRLLSRTTHIIFSPGICAEADGYQVKFSQGFGGFTTPYFCTDEEQQ